MQFVQKDFYCNTSAFVHLYLQCRACIAFCQKQLRKTQVRDVKQEYLPVDSWKYEVDGPAKGFSVESDSAGSVRGFLLTDHIPVDKPLDNWDLSPFLGEGTMTFITKREDDKVPQTSTVDVHNKNIALDLAYYFDQSEQIRTAFNTSIQMDKQGRVIGAGGLFLQVMPNTGGTKKLGSQVASSADWNDDEELLSKVEVAFKTCRAPMLNHQK